MNKTLFFLLLLCEVIFASDYPADGAQNKIQMGLICSNGSCQKSDSYPSVVRVAVSSYKSNSYGSGTLILYRGKTYILTCAHLFERMDDWTTVQFGKQTGRPVQPMAIDRSYDLAILDASMPGVVPEGAVPASINAVVPLPGAKVFAAGYGPNGIFKVTNAKVSGYVQTQGTDACDTLKAAYPSRGLTVRFGDSGGGVFNESGELVATLWGSDNDALYGTQIGRIIVFLQSVISPSVPEPIPGNSTVLPPPTLPYTSDSAANSNEPSLEQQLKQNLFSGLNPAQVAQDKIKDSVKTQICDSSEFQIFNTILSLLQWVTTCLPWIIVVWWSVHKKLLNLFITKKSNANQKSN